jgi:hypothetical protein
MIAGIQKGTYQVLPAAGAAGAASKRLFASCGQLVHATKAWGP